MAVLLPGIAFVISLWLLITPPWAQQPADAPEQTATTDIFNYGDVDKTCMQWTDGCRNCSRGVDQMPICSNIGIACQPQDKVTCLGRTPDSAKDTGKDAGKDSARPEDAKR
jgi:hypothetical protein